MSRVLLFQGVPWKYLFYIFFIINSKFYQIITGKTAAVHHPYIRTCTLHSINLFVEVRFLCI